MKLKYIGLDWTVFLGHFGYNWWNIPLLAFLRQNGGRAFARASSCGFRGGSVI